MASIFLKTRSRSSDYDFVGRKPDERWWLTYGKYTAFEAPTIILISTCDRWRLLVSGVPSRRRDRLGAKIRYTLILESMHSEKDLERPALHLVRCWIKDIAESCRVTGEQPQREDVGPDQRTEATPVDGSQSLGTDVQRPDPEGSVMKAMDGEFSEGDIESLIAVQNRQASVELCPEKEDSWTSSSSAANQPPGDQDASWSRSSLVSEESETADGWGASRQSPSGPPRPALPSEPGGEGIPGRYLPETDTGQERETLSDGSHDGIDLKERIRKVLQPELSVPDESPMRDDREDFVLWVGSVCQMDHIARFLRHAKGLLLDSKPGRALYLNLLGDSERSWDGLPEEPGIDPGDAVDVVLLEDPSCTLGPAFKKLRGHQTPVVPGASGSHESRKPDGQNVLSPAADLSPCRMGRQPAACARCGKTAAQREPDQDSSRWVLGKIREYGETLCKKIGKLLPTGRGEEDKSETSSKKAETKGSPR